MTVEHLAVLLILTFTAICHSEIISGSKHLPEQACASAVNLTDSWRLDHTGSNIMNKGYTCDLQSKLQWFRFQGAAGISCVILLTLMRVYI